MLEDGEGTVSSARGTGIELVLTVPGNQVKIPFKNVVKKLRDDSMTVLVIFWVIDLSCSCHSLALHSNQSWSSVSCCNPSSRPAEILLNGFASSSFV